MILQFKNKNIYLNGVVIFTSFGKTGISVIPPIYNTFNTLIWKNLKQKPIKFFITNKLHFNIKTHKRIPFYI